jgi:hypothetical protein
MKRISPQLTLAVSLTAMFSAFGQPIGLEITQQPLSRMIYVSTNATFSVGAAGSPAPSFQWRFNGNDLPGKTNASLIVVSAQFTNAGPYSVVVRNDGGSVTSQTAWLSVLPTNVVNLGDRELRFGDPSSPVWEGASIGDDAPTITGDGLSLFYISKAPGGLGGYDIWMATRPTLSAPWGTPVNLGATINSSADEATPRLSPDGLSLYFSSSRPGGLGHYDLWVATRPTPADTFNAPANLGPAINSKTLDDSTPQISGDNRTLVFVRSSGNSNSGLQVWMSTRTNALAPWEPARRLPPPIDDSINFNLPVGISRNGLLLFLKSDRPNPVGAPDSAIYVCSRSTQDQPFGPPALIRPILGPENTDFCSLLDDGRTLSVATYRNPDGRPQLRQMEMTWLPQLAASKGPGQLQLELLGREGATYELQISPDLNTWQPWVTTNTTASVQLSDPASAPEKRRFYRALGH